MFGRNKKHTHPASTMTVPVVFAGDDGYYGTISTEMDSGYSGFLIQKYHDVDTDVVLRTLLGHLNLDPAWEKYIDPHAGNVRYTLVFNPVMKND